MSATSLLVDHDEAQANAHSRGVSVFFIRGRLIHDPAPRQSQAQVDSWDVVAPMRMRRTRQSKVGGIKPEAGRGRLLLTKQTAGTAQRGTTRGFLWGRLAEARSGSGCWANPIWVDPGCTVDSAPSPMTWERHHRSRRRQVPPTSTQRLSTPQPIGRTPSSLAPNWAPMPPAAWS